MRIRSLIPPLAAAAVAVLTFGQAARADLLIEIDKSAQHMTVTVDGDTFVWPVATGADSYDTPSGEFKPFRMEIDHYSEEWDDRHALFDFLHSDRQRRAWHIRNFAALAMPCRTGSCGCR